MWKDWDNSEFKSAFHVLIWCALQGRDDISGTVPASKQQQNA
jgi:hypothetical protein